MERVLSKSPRSLMVALLSLAGFAVMCQPSAAQKIDQSRLDNAIQRSRDAAKVIQTVTSASEHRIPKELINRARAMGVFPDVKKANLLFQKVISGFGVVSSRLPGGWSPPAFYAVGMNELGLTSVSFKSPDVIMLFMNDKTLEWFRKGGFRFSDERIVFPGPVGELTREKENDIRAANIIAYATFNGELRGIKAESDLFSVAGINPDNNINKAIYGIKGREVLGGKEPKWPTVLPKVADFQNALKDFD
jgi:lipid-binding SYLF domain-containing protein